MRPFSLASVVLLAPLAILAAPRDRGAELAAKYAPSFVIVKAPEQVGSAFVGQIGKGKYLITNQHVLAGARDPKFHLLDRTQIKVGTAAAAIGLDIMTLGVPAESVSIEVMQEVEKNAAIGDEVIVLGNTAGEGVVRLATGKIIGIGPKLVEVSAPFQSGNSGSPIIHLKSGKAIAVAQSGKVLKADPSAGRMNDEIRRFGCRLDGITKWEPVRFHHFHDEFETLQKVKARTRELLTFLMVLRNKQLVDPALINDPELKVLVRGLLDTIKANPHTQDVALVRGVLTKFFRDLLAISEADIQQARRRIGYDFFKERLADEEQMRAPISQALDLVLQLDFLKSQ